VSFHELYVIDKGLLEIGSLHEFAVLLDLPLGDTCGDPGMMDELNQAEEVGKRWLRHGRLVIVEIQKDIMVARHDEKHLGPPLWGLPSADLRNGGHRDHSLDLIS